MESLTRDLRFGVRMLRRTPGFTLTAALTLGLGIGLSTAVFTVADALLLRRLPVRDQDRLVTLWGETRDRSFSNYPLDLADARAFARQTRTLESVAFFAYEGAAAVPVREQGRIAQLHQALVSGNFFDVTGAAPMLGRALRPDDDVNGARRVAVLTHRAWQRHFAGDRNIIGRRIEVHDAAVTYTIVGVMPQGLDYPRGTDFWTAIVPARTRPGEDTVFYAAVDLLGRLRATSTPENARDELTAYFRRPAASRWQRDLHAIVNTLPRLIVGDVRPAVIVFGIAVTLLLVITCVNVANLLLVRGLGRMREIAVRCALGAAQRRVIGQLMLENTLLAVAGAAAGIAIAFGAVLLFVQFAPPSLPRLDEIRVDTTAMIGAIGITGFAVLLFGLAPALMTSRIDLEQVLRSETRHSGSRRSRLIAESLVAAQVSLAVLVLSAAGLIARSLQKLESAELSFDSARLVIAPLAIRTDLFDTKDEQLALLTRVVDRVRAVPGVVAASPVVAVPFSVTAWDGRPSPEGQAREQAESNPMLNMELVGPDYFATLGIPVLRGRAFTSADRAGAPPVVVLSETAARHYWPNEDPIGKRVRMGPGLDQMLTVVGVVPNTRYRDLRDARPSIYFPLHQSFFPFAPTTLAIRTAIDPVAAMPALERAIDEVDPGVALSRIAPLESYLQGPLAQPRLNALLLAVFATTAVLLAAIGLFGVMMSTVRQRTREIGIRMALGATAHDLRRLVVGRGLVVTGVGVTAGLAGAIAANRFLGAMLYDVSPTDGWTLALVGGILLVVAGAATAIPARSSTRIDPVVALRTDM